MRKYASAHVTGHFCKQCTHAPGPPRERACECGRCANGLRVGCLYTRNPALLGIFDNLGYFASISTPTQARLTSGPHTCSCIMPAVATAQAGGALLAGVCDRAPE